MSPSSITGPCRLRVAEQLLDLALARAIDEREMRRDERERARVGT